MHKTRSSLVFVVQVCWWVMGVSLLALSLIHGRPYLHTRRHRALCVVANPLQAPLRGREPSLSDVHYVIRGCTRGSVWTSLCQFFFVTVWTIPRYTKRAPTAQLWTQSVRTRTRTTTTTTCSCCPQLSVCEYNQGL